jgi:hypothetical protein
MYDVGLGRFIGRDPKMKNEKKYMVPTPMAKNGYQDGMNLYAAYYVPNETDASGKSVTITLSNGTTIVVDTAADLVNALANLPSGVQIIDMTAVGHGNTSAQDQDLTTGSSTSAFQYLWPYGPSLRGPGVEPVPLATLFNNLFAPNATVHLHACLSGATQYNGSHYDNNLAKMISAIFPNVTVYGEAGEYYTFIGTDVQNPFQLFYDLFQNNSVNYYQNGQWIGNLSGPFSAFKLQLQLQTFGSSPQSPYAPGGPLYKFPGGY